MTLISAHPQIVPTARQTVMRLIDPRSLIGIFDYIILSGEGPSYVGGVHGWMLHLFFLASQSNIAMKHCQT